MSDTPMFPADLLDELAALDPRSGARWPGS